MSKNKEEIDKTTKGVMSISQIEQMRRTLQLADREMGRLGKAEESPKSKKSSGKAEESPKSASPKSKKSLGKAEESPKSASPEEPEFIFEKVDISSPMSIVGFLRDGRKIEIYGENHAKKITKKNTYTELIPHIKKEKPLVLVEHSTALCYTHDITPKMKETMLSTGGNQTIFVHLKDKYKDIECIDNRIEIGLLSAVQEIQLAKFLDGAQESYNEGWAEKSKEIALFFIPVVQSILHEIIKRFRGTIFEEFEKKYKETFLNQIMIVTMILRLLGEGKLNFQDIIRISDMNLPVYNLFLRILEHILINIKRFGSIIVDINILKHIEKNPGRDIMIFCGNNHLERLMLAFPGEQYIGKDEFHPELSDPMPDSSPMDKIIVEHLRRLDKRGKGTKKRRKSTKKRRKSIKKPRKSIKKPRKSTKNLERVQKKPRKT